MEETRTFGLKIGVRELDALHGWAKLDDRTAAWELRTAARTALKIRFMAHLSELGLLKDLTREERSEITKEGWISPDDRQMAEQKIREMIAKRSTSVVQVGGGEKVLVSSHQ